MEYTGEDIFSSLPDEILGRIVALLPYESALETSQLSTRWRDMWNKTLVLHGTTPDIADVVPQFLSTFKDLDPLMHPRKLQFHYGEGKTLSATISTNKKLLLDFWIGKREHEELFELQLKFNYDRQIVLQPFSSSFIVKTLYLKSVSFLNNEAASSLVSNLENLENLTIMDCSGLESLCIDVKSKLLKLAVLDCLQLKSLCLRTSKLKSFRFRGRLPWILPENHFNLAEAVLDFRQGPGCSDLKMEDFDPTLLTIKNAEILTLCEWTFKALISPSISPMSGNFIFYNLRELCWVGNYKDGCNSDALVSFLKLCPEIEQLFVTNDPESYCTTSSDSCLWQKTRYTELEHLKVIKFMGFQNQEEEISVAKDLIQIVKGKPPKIIASNESCLQIIVAESGFIV